MIHRLSSSLPCYPPTAVNGEASGQKLGHLLAVLKVFESHRSEEHTSELQSHHDLVCRLLLEKKKKHFSSFAKTKQTCEAASPITIYDRRASTMASPTPQISVMSPSTHTHHRYSRH